LGVECSAGAESNTIKTRATRSHGINLLQNNILYLIPVQLANDKNLRLWDTAVPKTNNIESGMEFRL